jgi:hypothetical protein
MIISTNCAKCVSVMVCLVLNGDLKAGVVLNTSFDILREPRTPLKTGGELRYSGRVSNSCSTSDTRRVNLVINPVISHEQGKNGKCLRQVEHIRCHSWHRYSITVNLSCACFVDRCLSFCTLSFGHCVVCSSSIYGIYLPLW